MTLITEMLITMVLIFSGTKIGEYFDDTMYEVLLENGQFIKVKTSISNNYSCPKQCQVNHYHNVIVCGKYYNDRYVINYVAFEKLLVLNNINILSIYQIKNKGEKSEDESFKKVQIDPKNFIKKLNM